MITKPKGTYDLEGKEIVNLRGFIDEIMDKYNYSYINTPVFESSDLFHRGVGETTDIVTKETYDFIDRGNRNMTLRPEGTAGIVRSYIENKKYSSNNIVKYYYLGRMYRYERPQAGRFREFIQFGCEAFGSNDPMMDAEMISIPVMLFRLLGLKNVKVNINSLGDSSSREAYRKALIKHFEPEIDNLCDDCKERFKKNPLRILDCKIDKDKEILKNAPTTIEHLNADSKKHFDNVLKYLDSLQIDYVINPSVVRGLDYYTYTVFEIEAEVEGKPWVLCGGGRYNNMVENLGGPKTPAVGFAIGIERLLSALKSEKINIGAEENLDCYIAPMSENEKEFSIALTASLRMLGLKIEIDYQSRSLKSNFKQAEKLGSKLIIIVGQDEIKNNYLTIKNLVTKEENKVKNSDLISFLEDALSEGCSHNHSCGSGDNCTCGDGECKCEKDHE